MAERRMFSKSIIDSDAFLELPVMSQLLYFHLSMRADDEGFVNSPRSIMRMIGAKDADIKTLIESKFLIVFENGVVVIKHWLIHNYIKPDRKKETKYKFERASLYLDENNSYSEHPQTPVSKMEPECLQDVSKMDTQDRLGKESIGKVSVGEAKVTVPPTPEDVMDFCMNEDMPIDIDRFINHYSSKGWAGITDWRPLVRSWYARDQRDKPVGQHIPRSTPTDKYAFGEINLDNILGQI